MELELKEMFDLNDVDKVLSTLESQLRTDFETVGRYGSQIVIFPATQPQQDIELAAIEAIAEEGHTTLTVVLSRESTSGSDDTMRTDLARGSIEGAIERMRVQLRTQRLRPATLKYDDPGSALPAPNQTVEVATGTPFAMRSEGAFPKALQNSVSATEATAAPRFLLRESLGEDHSHRLVMVITIGIAVAAGIAISGVMHVYEVPKAARQSSVSSSQTRRIETTPALPLVMDEQFAVRPERNVTDWVKDWAAALRSSDPEAQGSYYATEVEDYLGARAVSREFVIREKMADLKARLPVSLIKIEHVHIERQTKSEAVVGLVKHTISTAGQGDVTETFVKSRLKLRDVHGVWAILQEQDLKNTEVRALNGKKQG